MATTTTPKKRRRSATKPLEQPKTAPTIAAAAKELGVDERTLKTWRSKGCPWTPGAYDVAAIEEWRQRTLRPAQSKEADEWETRRRAAVAQHEELKLAKQQRLLIEVAEADRIVKRHAAEVRTHLEQFPDFAAGLVKLTAVKKREFVEAMRARIRDLCAAFERSEMELAEAAERE